MKVLALKYNDLKAPPEGTIFHHSKVIQKQGFVWYGKFGVNTNKAMIRETLDNETPKILLLNNKQTMIHWAYVSEITQDLDKVDLNYVPAYYRERADEVKTWFKVIKLEKVSSEILNDFVVCSSQKKLSTSAARGMASSYIVEPIE